MSNVRSFVNPWIEHVLFERMFDLVGEHAYAVTMSEQLTDLQSKLDTAIAAAQTERAEVLASIQALKALIVENDLTEALAKADALIAAIGAVHTPEDDATPAA